MGRCDAGCRDRMRPRAGFVYRTPLGRSTGQLACGVRLFLWASIRQGCLRAFYGQSGLSTERLSGVLRVSWPAEFVCSFGLRSVRGAFGRSTGQLACGVRLFLWASIRQGCLRAFYGQSGLSTERLSGVLRVSWPAEFVCSFGLRSVRGAFGRSTGQLACGVRLFLWASIRQGCLRAFYGQSGLRSPSGPTLLRPLRGVWPPSVPASPRRPCHGGRRRRNGPAPRVRGTGSRSRWSGRAVPPPG
jgi:lambda repressor-like predicted transcriptional regulator